MYQLAIAKHSVVSEAASKMTNYRLEAMSSKYDAIVADHVQYVKKQANKLQGVSNLEFEDLVNEGIIGLLLAAKRFDYGRNVTFLTYATPYVKKAMHNAISHHGNSVKVPVKRSELLLKVRAFIKQQTQDGKAAPTVDEIAFNFNVDTSDIINVLNTTKAALSLDARNETGASGYDYLPVGTTESEESKAVANESETGVLGLLSRLSEREQYIVKQALGLEDEDAQSLAEIARALDLTRERVRVIHKRALEKLQVMAREDGLS